MNRDEPFKIKASRPMEIASKNYQKLLTRIQKTIRETELEVEKTVARQKVILCWKIGKEIAADLQEKNTSGYGERIFSQLATDLKIEERRLYQMHAFFKAYPKLPSEEESLSWSHYRNLVSVEDQSRRKLLEDLAVKTNLSATDLQKKISKSNAKNKQKINSRKLYVTRGKLFTFSKAETGELDLGFNIFLGLNAANVIARSDFLSSVTASSKSKKVIGRSDFLSSVIARSEATRQSTASANENELPHFAFSDDSDKAEYTYVAKIERIVDGDTIHVKIDLGFDVTHQQILRLAKINAAEATTKEGKKATARLKEILKDIPFVVIKTNKTDIYGRYVADVFLPSKNFTPQQTASDGIYLNQLLLDEGLVTRY